jgi:hypothetical protein
MNRPSSLLFSNSRGKTATLLMHPFFLVSLLLLLLLLLLGSTTTAAAKQKRPPPTNKSTSRSIQILNESGSRLEVYWIQPQTRVGTLMSTPDVMNGASFPLNSYVGHEFELRELPSKSTGVCKSDDQTCRSVYFAVTENDDQSEFVQYIMPDKMAMTLDYYT